MQLQNKDKGGMNMVSDDTTSDDVANVVMNNPGHSILVLGIGNYLMGDEGVGVHLAKLLQVDDLPPGVDVVDGGTGGFHLLEYFERYSHVIIVDATLDGYLPGSIRILRPRFAADFPRAMSTHDIGMRDLVNALQLLDKLPDVWLIVMSIDSLQQQGIELTPAVQANMIRLRHGVLNIIDRLLTEKGII